MIRCIAAVDSKRGLANDYGMPWQGKIPTDVAHFREKTEGHAVLMGYVTYLEFAKPLKTRHNYVAAPPGTPPLRAGFEMVQDLVSFTNNYKDDIDLWIIGGGGVFAQTIQFANELYLTELEDDFHCTKFFPEYEKDFELVNKSAPISENDITFHFTIWKRIQNTRSQIIL